jgi:TolB-like protein
MSFFQELKRRNVFRVGAAYVLLGWLVIQVTDTVSPALNLPDWTLGLVTWLGIIGFPFALFFAWAFELTPDGIKREVEVDQSDSITAATGQKLDFALVGLLALTIGFIAWSSFNETPDGDTVAGNQQAETSTAGAPESLSIAVLPLINMSAVTDNAFFAGGVHEEILTNLSRIQNLRVVSRTTALRYINSELTLRDIGRELGVRFIVEGSVRRINNHVRITVQLIDAADDVHLWASNYDRELVDVFATQSEVAQEITNSLHLEIQPDTVGTLDDMPTRSVKAYDLYMKARSIDRSEPESENALQRQRELLEAAVAEDPDFVEAWAWLNEILNHMARNILQQEWFGDTQQERNANFEEFRQAGERALNRAVALDHDNIEALLAQASDYVREQEDRDFQVSRKAFIDRAIELEPDNAVAWHVLGWWYRIEGDPHTATPAFHKALELDPLHARIVFASLQHFRLAGDQEMTTLLYERLAQIAPEEAEDTSLAELPIDAKLDNLLYTFLQSADESIIDLYATELAAFDNAATVMPKDAPNIEKFRKEYHTANLLQMRGDLDGLLAMTPAELPDNPSYFQLLNYFWSGNGFMAAQLAGDRTEEAARTARRLLNAKSEWADTGGPLTIFYTYATIRAHAVLGDEEEVRQVRQSLLDQDNDELFDQFLSPFIALSVVDLDEAVKRLLEHKAEHPTLYVTDWVAALHVYARNVIVHPDMQAFYLEEGKWIDYLAARVPEYAKYGR